MGVGRGRQVTQPVVQRDPTLLEKLLAKDIRTEHSRLLQCMRFIVANNFLQDVGAKALQFPPEPPAAAGQAPSRLHPDILCCALILLNGRATSWLVAKRGLLTL